MFFNQFPHYLQCTLVAFALIQHNSLMTVKGGREQITHSFSYKGNDLHMTKAFHNFKISHEEHWPCYFFALLQQLLLVHMNI